MNKGYGELLVLVSYYQIKLCEVRRVMRSITTAGSGKLMSE